MERKKRRKATNQKLSEMIQRVVFVVCNFSKFEENVQNQSLERMFQTQSHTELELYRISSSKKENDSEEKEKKKGKKEKEEKKDSK